MLISPIDLILLTRLHQIEQIKIKQLIGHKNPDQTRHIEQKRLNAQEQINPLVIAENALAPSSDREHVVVVGLVDVVGAFQPTVLFHVFGVAAELGRHPAVDGRAEEASESGEDYEAEEEVCCDAVGEAIHEEVIVAELADRCELKGFG